MMKEEDEVIVSIIIDIRNFLYKDNKEYVTNQVIIRQKYTFQGYVVKEQSQDIITNIRCDKINRKLIKLLVMYYVEYQKNKNELYNNERVNHEFMI